MLDNEKIDWHDYDRIKRDLLRRGEFLKSYIYIYISIIYIPYKGKVETNSKPLLN